MGPSIKPSRALLAKYRATLIREKGTPGLSGVDIGFIPSLPRIAENLVVRVHLRNPAPMTRNAAISSVVPGASATSRVGVASPEVTVRGDYAEHVGSATVERDRVTFQNPLRPGISISHESLIGGGTLGLLVRRNDTGALCALSSQHVLVMDPDLVGDENRAVQPSPLYDDAEDVGQVVRSMRKLRGDAAIVELARNLDTDPRQWGTDVVIRSARSPQLGEIVCKSGVGTGKTCGVVDGIGRYFLTYVGAAVAIDGFRIVPEIEGSLDEISGPGDSGAVWYSEVDEAGIGLHVGGERMPDRGAEHAIACLLQKVLAELDVTPLGGLEVNVAQTSPS